MSNIFPFSFPAKHKKYKTIHPYMSPYVHGDAPNPTHQDILEEEHTREDYVINVLLACRRI